MIQFHQTHSYVGVKHCDPTFTEVTCRNSAGTSDSDSPYYKRQDNQKDFEAVAKQKYLNNTALRVAQCQFCGAWLLF